MPRRLEQAAFQEDAREISKLQRVMQQLEAGAVDERSWLHPQLIGVHESVTNEVGIVVMLMKAKDVDNVGVDVHLHLHLHLHLRLLQTSIWLALRDPKPNASP